MDTVQLTPLLKENLVGFVEKSISEKKGLLTELQNKMSSIQLEIEELESLKKQLDEPSSGSSTNSIPSGFPHSIPKNKKRNRLFEYARKPVPSTRRALNSCLENEKRLLSTDDFIKLIDKYFPDKFMDKDRSQKRATVSGSLSGLYSSGKLRRLPNTLEQGFIYGLVEWFDGDHLSDEIAHNTVKAGQNLNYIKFE